MVKVGIVRTENILLIKKNIKLIKKVLRQYLYFSTRLAYANKEIREKNSSMNNTKYNTTEDMIIKRQSLKRKTKLKFRQNVSNFYDERNIRMQCKTFQFEEDTFSKSAESIIKIYHEVLL